MNTLSIFLRRLARCMFLIPLLTLLAPGSASAEVTGRISVGTLTFTLTDLDLTDGISPSLAFLPLPYVPEEGKDFYRAFVDNYFLESPGAGQHSLVQYGSGTTDLTHSYLINDNLWVSSALTGRDQPGSHRIEIETFAHTTNKTRRDASGTVSTGLMPFILSPNTAVAFQVEVDVAANIHQDFLREDLFGAGAWMVLYLGDTVVEDRRRYDASAELRTDLDTYASLDVTDTIQVAIENSSDTYASGSIHFVGYSHVTSNLAPGIPEPSMLPMLAAGLLVVGIRRWRSLTSRL